MQTLLAAAVRAAVAAACVGLGAGAAVAFDTGFDALRPPADAKRAAWNEVGAARRGQDGDDFEHAWPIAAVPFTDTGNTCGFRDDVDAPCTFLGGAPDVVYTFRPASDVVVDIDLCDVGYDAALHVYAGTDSLVACNDDACDRGPRVAGLTLAAGVRYFFVIDGWFGACGGYTLSILTDPAPCPMDFPATAVPEGEPDCTDGVFDRFNGGCNDFPYAFRRLECDAGEIVVRGSYGTYAYYTEEHRDTDWYEVVVRQPGTLSAGVLGAAPTQLAILDGRLGCGEYAVACGSVLGGACEAIACDAAVEPGVYWVFVATRWYTGIRCPTAYRLWVRGAGCASVPVAPTSWGRAKLRYR
jgi:hypothetical protein